MMRWLRNWRAFVEGKVDLSRRTVHHRGVVLPPRRNRLCGTAFWDDDYFLESAQAEARRLVDEYGLRPTSAVLDIGCGFGRLPIGILRAIGDIRLYRGVDVNQSAVRWCQANITPTHPTFQFILTNIHNQRYNPLGDALAKNFCLPFSDAEFDIVYLYSVFSHMEIDDVRAYLDEFHRLLKPNGSAFLTAFVEDNVDPVAVNPSGYKMEWNGPLHCVRYGRSFFDGIIGQHFAICHFSHGTAVDGQSVYHLRPNR
jgi:SAM-dependent methyltransferase